jgi:predicted porin
MQVGRARLIYRGVIGHKAKALTCALVLIGFASAAQADGTSTGSTKDTGPTTTVAGVTVYGAIDIGYAYQTHGAPLSGFLSTGLQYNMFGSTNSNRQISSIAPNGLSNSFIGVKVEESLGWGWTAIAKLESGIQPLTGEFTDGCASLARANGVDIFHQVSKGDSSRCGQFLNQAAWGGVSNAAFGTLTAGRQNNLDLELQAAYDPMALSYAFSLIGYSGGAGAGIGDTEASRWDNSVKYVYQYGPVHVAGMYAQGGQDTAMHSDGWGANIGGTLWGLSVDFVYQKENSVVSGASLSAAQVAGLPLGFGIDKTLAATISDNTGIIAAAKYTFDFSGAGLKDGGYKDNACCCTGSADDPWWCGKLTLYAGYQHVSLSNPTDLGPNPPVTVPNAVVGPPPVNQFFATATNFWTTIGGYKLAFVNNNAYVSDRVLQTWWAGAKYDLPSNWSFAIAYYRIDQNNYVRGAVGQLPGTDGVACFAAARVVVGTRVTPPTQCAGELNMGSFLIDYAFNKYFDVYAGVNYSQVDGGLESGFLQDNSFLFMTGARLRF